MSFADQARAQILLQVRAEGQGDVDKVVQQIDRVKEQMAAVQNAMGTGAIELQQYQGEWRALASELGFYTRRLAEMDAPAARWIKAEMDRIAASQKASEEIARANEKVNASLDKLAADVEKDAAREIKAEMDRLAAVEKSSQEWIAANEKVNASLDKLAATEQAASDKITAANKAEVDAAASLSRQKQAALDAITRKVTEHEGREGDAFESYKRGLMGVNREQAALNNLLEDGADYENVATTATGKAAQAHKVKSFEIEKSVGTTTQYIDVTSRANQVMNQGKTSAEHMAMGLLHISHAAQDAQYGLGAVINNIPLVTSSVVQMIPSLSKWADTMGGPAGVAGAAMLVGVGINLLAPKIVELATSLGLVVEPAHNVYTALEQIEDAIKKLEAKPLKMAFDFADITNARHQLELLKREQAQWDQMREAKTTTQEKVAKAVKEAIVEHAGASDEEGGTANLAKLVEAAQVRAGTFGQGAETVAARDQKARIERELKTQQGMVASGMLSPEAQIGALNEIARLTAESKAMTGTIQEESRKGIHGMIVRAAAGSAKAVNELAAAMDAAPDIFAGGAGVGRGVDPKFRGELELARPENIKAAKLREEANKRSLDKVKDDAAEAARLAAQAGQGDAAKDAARNQLISTFAGNFGQEKGLGGFIAGEAVKLIAGGTDKGDVKQAMMKTVQDRLQAGGVPAELTDEVAATILNRIIDKVLSELVASGPDLAANARANIGADKAKADKKEAAADKADDAKQAAAKKAQAKDITAKEKAGVARNLMGQFAGGIDQGQAQAGANMFEGFRKQGDNPALAMTKVQAKMAEFFRENLMTMAMMNGNFAQMEGMIAQATVQMQGLQAQAAMMGGKIRNQRTNKPFMPNTIGGF